MSENKKTVERYMDGFRKGDHVQILSCLTDDVVWELPGGFRKQGKKAFDEEIENPAFQGHPDIVVNRMTEEAGVVVAEGAVRTRKKNGDLMTLAFCDVFELRDGLIARLVSYLMQVR